MEGIRQRVQICEGESGQLLDSCGQEREPERQRHALLPGRVNFDRSNVGIFAILVVCDDCDLNEICPERPFEKVKVSLGPVGRHVLADLPAVNLTNLEANPTHRLFELKDLHFLEKGLRLCFQRCFQCGETNLKVLIACPRPNRHSLWRVRLVLLVVEVHSDFLYGRVYQTPSPRHLPPRCGRAESHRYGHFLRKLDADEVRLWSIRSSTRQRSFSLGTKHRRRLSGKDTDCQ